MGTPNSMVYRTDMQRPVDMVYMSMDPTSRGTLITGRMSTNDLLKGSDMDRSIVGGMDKFSMGMDMYRMNDMEQKHMDVDLMSRNNLMNTMGMRRTNMDATNPVELMRMGAKPEMEVRRFQMVPNMI